MHSKTPYGCIDPVSPDAWSRHTVASRNRPCWDATQMLVERQLLASDISRHDLGREKFLERFGIGNTPQVE